ncbi:MAG: putative toxin-antitoxin system toxin component, PIN family [Euryarchaeota archaeon]|nr:putative toxin-antitoxin system toxin component, PIN family [Euryarchaeota archaeon]
MKVFLDSNVVVSGIAFRGKSHAILVSTFSSKHRFVLSEDVHREATEVLRRKFPRLRREAQEILSLIRAEVVPAKDYQSRLAGFPALRDPKDAHVLAAALAAGCDLIVTGDRDLLEIGRIEGAAIASPADALRILHE